MARIIPPVALATVALGVFNADEPELCALSDAPIEIGDLAYMFRLSNRCGAPLLYAREDAAQDNRAFMQSVADREKCMIPAALVYRARFRDYRDVADQEREIQQLRERLGRDEPELAPTLDRLLPVLDAPDLDMNDGLSLPRLDRPPPTQEELWQTIRENLSALDAGHNPEIRRRGWEFLGPLALSEFHPRLVALWPGLSQEVRAMLAFTDNPVFARLAEADNLLPEWEVARARLAAKRQTLDDTLAFAEWGRRHPEALRLIERVHERFDLFGGIAMPDIGIGEMLSAGRNARPILLFSARPDLCPMLGAFGADAMAEAAPEAHQEHGGRTGELLLLHLCRAKVFAHLLSGETEAARRFLGAMSEWRRRRGEGELTAFADATARMADAYIGKHFMA